MNNDNKVPVYILSGFLGSGKTTVLLHLLQHCKEKGMQPGIILNEIGQINVENHLFENQKVFELLNGCICCTMQDDLKETMDELQIEMKNNPIDILLIEGTGVANPLEIQETLLSSRYIDQFELMSIITVIDASHYMDYQSIFSSSAEIRVLMKEQLICASLLLLNKTDLVPMEQLDKMREKIWKIANEDKKIIECVHGQVDAELLLQKRIHSYSIRNSYENGTHHHNDHSAVQAIKVEEIPPLSQKAFVKWFKQLPPTVLRGKGYIEFEGSHHLYSFQYASGKVLFTPVPPSLTTKPIVILIGMGVDEEQIQQYFMPLFH